MTVSVVKQTDDREDEDLEERDESGQLDPELESDLSTLWDMTLMQVSFSSSSLSFYLLIYCSFSIHVPLPATAVHCSIL